MSRWLPDAVRFTLAPDRLAVARQPHRLNFRARREPPAAGQSMAVPPAGDGAPAWRAGLATLAETLAAMDGHDLGRAHATVVLADPFVRYALAPWSDLIGDEAEEEALARHCLRQTFGAAADPWELRVSPTPPGATRLVSAVEPTLLAELREIFGRSGVRLVSIQPGLMALYNDHRHQLAGRDAWLALVEPGCLCLVLLQGGQIARLRQLRVGQDWKADLIKALERESYMADAEVATRDVYLACAADADLHFPADLRWNITLLEAPAAPGA